MIGQRLGPYEITAKLGEGGMGEVYRATDTTLERPVAIKVLPAAFTEDRARLARFEREAKLLAQLNHPSIAQIYGLETSGETRALLMEFVPGPTLAEHLESGPLSFTFATAARCSRWRSTLAVPAVASSPAAPRGWRAVSAPATARAPNRPPRTACASPRCRAGRLGSPLHRSTWRCTGTGKLAGC